jgi:hypothetical protein
MPTLASKKGKSIKLCFYTALFAIKRWGLEKKPLLVVFSSYIYVYVSVLHHILIDFVLES